MTTTISTTESTPLVEAISEEDTNQIVDFLGKGYSDEDCFHIIPTLSDFALKQIKQDNSEKILRDMRDYYLISRHNDDTMDRLESLALGKLEEALAIEIDPTKLLKVFQTINAAKRRSQGEGQVAGHTTINNTQKIVQIQMPARMLSHAPEDFETNSRNEVIRVGSTHMTTATNTQVLEQLKAHRLLTAEELLDAI